MSIKVSRILHAGYLFEQEETRIIFDPIFENPFSQNCYAFPEVEFKLDLIKQLDLAAIFISHFHDDHCSLESLNLLNKNIPIYIYCMDTFLIEIIRKLGFKKITQLKINDVVVINKFKIKVVEALESEVDSLFAIEVLDLKILNVVDALISDEVSKKLAQLAPWDLVLWPYQIMRETDVLSPRRSSTAITETPTDFIEQLKLLQPKNVVPSSCQFIHENWSWYNESLFSMSYKQFNKDINQNIANCRVVKLNPAQSIYITSQKIESATNLNWVKVKGDPDIDYKYNPQAELPSTSDIAKNLRSSLDTELQRVLCYCQYEIINQYKNLELSDEAYFKQSVLWKLVLHEQNGSSKQFIYKILKDKIELIADETIRFSWLTELPLVKLFDALENGEALTSMYIRINDTQYTDAIENQITQVDLLQDPLIRCLFNGSPYRYQLAQLKKLNIN